jgi:hypothetical protein
MINPEQIPFRVQRKRTKGWRAPENTAYVGRGTKWGNDYRVICVDKKNDIYYVKNEKTCYQSWESDKKYSHEHAVFMYRNIQLPRLLKTQDIHELTGKNLMCFCPLDLPCHCDPLLKLANE